MSPFVQFFLSFLCFFFPTSFSAFLLYPCIDLYHCQKMKQLLVKHFYWTYIDLSRGGIRVVELPAWSCRALAALPPSVAVVVAAALCHRSSMSMYRRAGGFLGSAAVPDDGVHIVFFDERR
jgi:hypothetical protein